MQPSPGDILVLKCRRVLDAFTGQYAQWQPGDVFTVTESMPWYRTLKRGSLLSLLTRDGTPLDGIFVSKDDLAGPESSWQHIPLKSDMSPV